MFSYLYENFDGIAQELLQVNTRIPVGVGAGISVFTLIRFDTDMPEFQIKGLRIVTGVIPDTFLIYVTDFFNTLEDVLRGYRP